MNREFEPAFGASTARLTTLIDGVFSIVMTLMIFNIALPKDDAKPELRQTLFQLWPSFVAFAISFGMAGIYWSANHNMFRFIVRTSHELIWLTLLFLAFVSLLPFSTQLLSQHHEDKTALLFYGANLELIGLTLFWIWCHATSDHRLVESTLPTSVIQFGRSRIVAGIVGYGLATVLAFADCNLSLVVFLLVPMLFVVPSVQHWWARRFGLEQSVISE